MNFNFVRRSTKFVFLGKETVNHLTAFTPDLTMTNVIIDALSHNFVVCVGIYATPCAIISPKIVSFQKRVSYSFDRRKYTEVIQTY